MQVQFKKIKLDNYDNSIPVLNNRYEVIDSDNRVCVPNNRYDTMIFLELNTIKKLEFAGFKGRDMWVNKNIKLDKSIIFMVFFVLNELFVL